MGAQDALEGLPVATPALRAIIERYRSTLSEPDCRELLAYLASLAAEYVAELGRHVPGPDRARATQRLVDREVAATSGVAPTCTRGCAACCHLEVEITHDDAELLAQRIREGLPIDRNRLALQAARERKSAAWASLVSPENRCVFLGDDNSCNVYDDRPATCRKHLVFSPPVECFVVGGRPQPILIPRAELVISAALSLADNPYASLPRSILAVLDRHG